MHVAQAWEVAQNDESSLHDPVTQGLLNGAEVVRAELLAKLGTDLTVQKETNCFWHTGHEVKLTGSTDSRGLQPWEFMKNVSLGTATGLNRGKRQHWRPCVQHIIDRLLFPK